jgi:hypothetical protein
MRPEAVNPRHASSTAVVLVAMLILVSLPRIECFRFIVNLPLSVTITSSAAAADGQRSHRSAMKGPEKYSGGPVFFRGRRGTHT